MPPLAANFLTGPVVRFGRAAAMALFLSACVAAEPPAPSPVALQAGSRWTVIGEIDQAAYPAQYAGEPVRLDGILDDAIWDSTPWSAPFGDILGPGNPPPQLLTRMKLAWDSTYLYVAADMDEPHLWSTRSDSTKPVWHEDDFEVFIDPDGDTHDYFELEINLLNTRNQVHFPRAYGDAGRSDRRAWFGGLVSRLALRGTLNDHRDIDEGWSIEVAFPWTEFERYGTGGKAPDPGDVWRMNFARVDWAIAPDTAGTGYNKLAGRKARNWTWSPQGIVLMHVPEMWGHVQFRRDQEPTDARTEFYRRARRCLLDLYYRNREYREAVGRNATATTDLYGTAGPACALSLGVQKDGFIASIVDSETGSSASIDHRRHLSFPATDQLSVDLR